MDERSAAAEHLERKRPGWFTHNVFNRFAGTPAVLRASPRRWKLELAAFFDDAGADSSAQELLGAAAKHPVFRILRGAL